MIKKNQVEFRVARHIPFYFELIRYEWVSKYGQYLDKAKQVNTLKQEKKRVEGLLPSKDDFIERLKVSFEKLKKRRAESLKNFLLNAWRLGNPLTNFNLQAKRPDYYGIPVVPLWEELQEALDGITIENSVNEREREKLISKVEGDLGTLEKDFKKLRPEKYFTGPDGTGEDMRKAFVDAWTKVQAMADGPVGPTGLTLEKSPEAERQAHHDLGLEKFVSPGAAYKPHLGIGILPSDPIPAEGDSFTSRRQKQLRREVRNIGHQI